MPSPIVWNVMPSHCPSEIKQMPGVPHAGPGGFSPLTLLV